MAVEKLEIGKEYYLDNTKLSKGICKVFREETSGVGFKPTNDTGYMLDKDGLIYFTHTKEALVDYYLVEQPT